MRMIRCWDLRLAKHIPPCCLSCHEDEEEYNYFLSGDGESYAVCCSVANWLESFGVDIYEPAPPWVLAEIDSQLDNG
jgi:hypothetical protein